MIEEIIKAVFDCGVFLQGLISKSGPAVACLELVEQGKVKLFVSEETLAEIKVVLSRPRLRRKNPDLTDEKVEKLIEMLLDKGEFIKKVPQHFAYSRDPDDEPYINLAIEANAVFLVSRDNDLLNLMTDYTDECKDFRRRFRGLKIVNPVEFLKSIEK
ncbi:MAG: putative toxin-antitoxin system toxin component, PIN family [Pyrinomonadaceae bacterium]